MPAKIAGFFTFKNCFFAQCKPNASPCICFFPACQIKDLSAPLTLINSLTALQRRLTTVAAKAHRFRLHPVNFFPACQIKDLSVRCRSQRRLTTVAAKAHRFRLHPVNFFPACQIKDLSVRCRSQRRLTTVAAKAHRFRLHPVDVFS